MWKCLLVLCLLSTPVLAADRVLPILLVSDSGYSWMIQDEDGTPVVYKFSQVVVLGKPTGPGVPPSTPEFGLTAQATTWLTAVTDKSEVAVVKKALTDVVTMISVKGKLKTTGEVEAVTGALLVNSIKNKAVWGSFAGSLNQAMIQLQNDKRIVTPDDYGRAISEVLKAFP